jgi:hypothetical protein
MLVDAVLPPSEDHMYAQWREKPEPAEGSLDLSGGKNIQVYFFYFATCGDEKNLFNMLAPAL